MTLASLHDIDDSSLQARVCIIGSGAAGVTLACELDGRGYKVLLLEAGGLGSGRRLAEYYRGEAEAPHPDPTQFRRVGFGGTTALWGGRCVPLDPFDFERREYLADSGWPIGYAEVARHYPRAMEYCDAGKFDFTSGGSLHGAAALIAGFDGRDVVIADRIERYSLPTHFGNRYRRKLRDSRNVSGVLQARCVRLVKAPGADRIAAAEVVDRTGRRREVTADVFVLATGGVEVPRLLLLSDPEGAGLGNRHDLVGRYYMCHFDNNLGRLVPAGAKVAFDFERTSDGVYCRRQLRFSAAALAGHQLLNTAFRLHFPSYSDATHGSSVMSGIYLAKSLLLPEYRAIMQQSATSPPSPASSHLRNVVTGLPQLVRFSGDWLFRIQLARRKLPYTLVPNADGSYPIELNSEQAPMACNRVSLGEGSDCHGLRRVRIEWRLCDWEIAAARRALLLLRSVVNGSGVARLELREADLDERLRASPPLGGHHMGTARMAATPSRGVVDGNCAVFGLPNLFIASSAVFPTSGHANPTLTIVALAVRLAAHLDATLQGATVAVGEAVRASDRPLETS